MAVNFYLEKRLSKQGEAPIRCSIMIKGNRLTTTTGYSIKPELWNADRQEARQTAGGKPVVNSKGKTAKVINAHLKRIDSFFSDYENGLALSGESVADLKAVYNGEFGKAGRGNDAEANGFFDYFDEFTAEMGARNDWTASTFGKFAALKKHIADFAPAIEFADLDNNGLTKFVEFLRNTLDMRNSTIGKQLGFLKWFLRWATQKGYNQETAYQQFSPKLKARERPLQCAGAFVAAFLSVRGYVPTKQEKTVIRANYSPNLCCLVFFSIFATRCKVQRDRLHVDKLLNRCGRIALIRSHFYYPKTMPRCVVSKQVLYRKKQKKEL